ncbi:YbbC/YhhH family protein [Candidatus Sumerlaeota bacterium]|nr:YbbC/YhhH family protein [Candidatus Sumerlaeota bacterium]
MIWIEERGAWRHSTMRALKVISLFSWPAALILLSACSKEDRRVRKNLTGAEEQVSTDEIPRDNYVPPGGVVPDEETAIRIAEAAWAKIYGQQQLDGEKPFKAKLKDGVWHVEGSLPEGWEGGVAEAEISKQDGRILCISHGE